MIYDMMHTEMNRKTSEPAWPESDFYLKAMRLPDQKLIKIPAPGSNVLVTGGSGYGKTHLTKEMTRQIFRENPDQFAVFFQIKPDDFTSEFLQPHDKIVTIDERICSSDHLFRWCLIREIRSKTPDLWQFELERISSILFSDLLQDARNKIWAEGAKSTFEGFLKVILFCYSDCPSNRTVIHTMESMDRKALMEFLAKYKGNHSMLKDNFEYIPGMKNYDMPRKGSDILFFLQNVLSKFKGSFLSDGQDTIADYMNGKYGKRLFILHDHKWKESSQVFERYFMQYICQEMLSLASDYSRKMLWVLDEIDKIEHDFGLSQALTLGRQFNLQIIVSTQSTESMFAIAPEKAGDHITKASFAGFGTTVCFHPGDADTIELLQKYYGEERKQYMEMPLSRYDKPVVKSEMRPKVENEELASLGTGEFYIKIREADPVRAKLVY